MNKQRPVYIIAEAGVNHNGSVETAKKLVDFAVAAGSDAVKFQTFVAERLVTVDAPKADYQRQTTEVAESQYAMLKKLELSAEAHVQLMDYCRLKGIEFLSTPFDSLSADYLVKELQLSKLKISSGDLTNAPFLLQCARLGTDIILSTGMATMAEVEAALGVLAFGFLREENKAPSVEAFQAAYHSPTGKVKLKEKVSLLHCTTEYPAPFDEVNLKAMDTMRNAFDLPVGFSDHTPGIAVALAAAARGADIIEKHFTLDRNMPGPDHKASLEPVELQNMIQGIRQIELALGDGNKMPAHSEIKNRAIARKSLVTSRFVSKGTLFSVDNVACKRPGNGMDPIRLWEVLGKQATRDYQKDEQIL